MAARARSGPVSLSGPDKLVRVAQPRRSGRSFVWQSPMASRTHQPVVPWSRSPHPERRPDHLFGTVGQKGRGAMALSLDAAAEVFREAMRDTVKRYALWYLIQ